MTQMQYLKQRSHNPHTILLDHLRNGMQQFECTCGETALGPERMVRALITAHRMEEFYRVRERLGA